MKLKSKLTAGVLCSVFALALAGCDNHAKPANDTKAPAPAAAVVPAPVATAPAPAETKPLQAWEKPADERTYSNGEREGHVTKFSFKSSPVPKFMEGDNFEACKNWEGELSMENTVTNNSVSASGASTGGNSFSFSVGKGRKDMVRKLQNALHSQHRVALQYDQVVNHDECKSRTDYYIVGVKDLEPAPPATAAATTQPAKAVPKAPAHQP
jgi:hypothetical protein